MKDQANAVNAQAEATGTTALLSGGGGVEGEPAVAGDGGAGGGIDCGGSSCDPGCEGESGIYEDFCRLSMEWLDCGRWMPGNIVHASDTTGLLVVTQLQPIAVIFTLPEDQLPQVLKRTAAGDKLAVEAYDRCGPTHLATGKLLTWIMRSIRRRAR